MQLDMELIKSKQEGRGLFVINREQLDSIKELLEELRDWRDDRGLGSEKVNAMLDSLPD